jgi:pseudouridine kinase
MEQRPYVVVIGGANMDICGRPTGEVVAGDSNLGTVRLSPGGVGRNIAHNLALLGVAVRLVTCFGEDAQADALVESCAVAGIDIAHSFAVAGSATSTYLYVTDARGEMQVAINDMAILEQLTPERVAERLEVIQGAAAVVVDTNVPAETIRWIAEHVTRPLFCDPISTVKARRVTDMLGAFCTLKPNRLEAETLSGVAITDEASLGEAAAALLATGLERVFVSLGSKGVLCAEKDQLVRLPLLPCEVVNTTGGGDAMMAGLVWAYLQGFDLRESGLAGLAASVIAVESPETVSPAMSVAALEERMGLA